MKIKKVFDICKHSKHIITFKFAGEQWVTDGYAAYCLSGMPELTEELICQLYDISDKQRENIHFDIDRPCPDMLCFNDNDINEEYVDCPDIGLDINSFGVCLPFAGTYGFAVIPEKYLSLLMDVQSDSIFFCMRVTEDGSPYIAVKIGMILYAVMYPKRLSKSTIENLGHIYSNALRDWKSKNNQENSDNKELK